MHGLPAGVGPALETQKHQKIPLVRSSKSNHQQGNNSSNRTIEILEFPVLRWTRWLGFAGGLLGFLTGLIPLTMAFVSPEAYSSSVIPRVVFGYGAPITMGILWGASLAVSGAILTSTYNHLASIFGGLKVECEVSDVE
jgi:hypothetical protein